MARSRPIRVVGSAAAASTRSRSASPAARSGGRGGSAILPSPSSTKFATGRRPSATVGSQPAPRKPASRRDYITTK